MFFSLWVVIDSALQANLTSYLMLEYLAGITKIWFWDPTNFHKFPPSCSSSCAKFMPAIQFRSGRTLA